MYEDTYCGFIYIKYIKLVSLYITIIDIDSMVEKKYESFYHTIEFYRILLILVHSFYLRREIGILFFFLKSLIKSQVSFKLITLTDSFYVYYK